VAAIKPGGNPACEHSFDKRSLRHACYNAGAIDARSADRRCAGSPAGGRLGTAERGTTMSYGITIQQELRGLNRELRRSIPQVYEGYKQLHDAALAAGALDAKTKELIALGIAVSKECD